MRFVKPSTAMAIWPGIFKYGDTIMIDPDELHGFWFVVLSPFYGSMRQIA
jgi:hypothetical protein